MIYRLPFPARRLGSRLGWPGVIGGAGLAMCLVLYFSAVQPARQRLDTARSSTASLQQRIAQAGHPSNGSVRSLDEQLAAFYQLFPSEHDATDSVGAIAAIAQRDGLRVQQAEYKVERDKTGRLIRFQMSLPLKGDYQAIRSFLSHLRAELPIVSLEQVQFDRQKVGDPLVDAKIRLVIFLGKSS